MKEKFFNTIKACVVCAALLFASPTLKAQQLQTWSFSPTAWSTNLVMTGNVVVTSITLLSTVVNRVSFYDATSTNVTIYNTNTYITVSNYTGYVTNYWTNLFGSLVTNIQYGNISLYYTNAANVTNVLPVQASYALQAGVPLTVNANLHFVRGIVGSTSNAVSAIIYYYPAL